MFYQQKVEKFDSITVLRHCLHEKMLQQRKHFVTKEMWNF